MTQSILIILKHGPIRRLKIRRNHSESAGKNQQTTLTFKIRCF